MAFLFNVLVLAVVVLLRTTHSLDIINIIDFDKIQFDFI